MLRAFVSTYRMIIQSRMVAYNRVFDAKNQYTKVVLLDLSKFCRAHESTFHKDPRLHAMLEGRREVWLKIQEYLQLTEQEIYDLHKIKEIIPKETSDGQDRMER